MKKIILYLALFLSSALLQGPLASWEYNDDYVELQYVADFSSPTERFLQSHSPNYIVNLLRTYHATDANLDMFERMIGNETSGFFGYHGGSSDYRIFQDVIKIGIEELLNIPIRKNFYFLRVPGLDCHPYTSAEHFLYDHPTYNDPLPNIQAHIMSLNMSLYQSYDAVWDLTPRYFLENRPWTAVQFADQLKPFFEQLGINPARIKDLYQLARSYVPQYRGIILQFFDASHEVERLPYAFLDSQAYSGNSGGKNKNALIPSQHFIDSKLKSFPQFRLVMSNYGVLNPNSPIVIYRYHTMHPAKEFEYEQKMREFMRSLTFDKQKASQYKETLLHYWYNTND